MAGNIIPAIATTNAITAGVCVLQAFKVLREDLDSARMVFLSRSADRVFSTEKLSAPNPKCEVCGVARGILSVDCDRATLGDLIDGYLTPLGYGAEISILTDQLLYDVDFDDNTEKRMVDLGIQDGTFVTVIDETETEDDDGRTLPPRVNLVLSVSHGSIPGGSSPIQAPPISFPPIPRKPKQEAQQSPGAAAGKEMNGSSSAGMKRTHDEMNDVDNTTKKRKLDDATAQLSIKDEVSGLGKGGAEGKAWKGKGKGKMMDVDGNGDVEIVEVADDGVIMID